MSRQIIIKLNSKMFEPVLVYSVRSAPVQPRSNNELVRWALFYWFTHVRKDFAADKNAFLKFLNGYTTWSQRVLKDPMWYHEDLNGA